MNNIQLYTKISGLSADLQYEVNDFIEFLEFKTKNSNDKKANRIAGKAKGLLKIKENFDDPIEGFKDYVL